MIVTIIQSIIYIVILLQHAKLEVILDGVFEKAQKLYIYNIKTKIILKLMRRTLLNLFYLTIKC